MTTENPYDPPREEARPKIQRTALQQFASGCALVCMIGVALAGAAFVLLFVVCTAGLLLRSSV